MKRFIMFIFFTLFFGCSLQNNIKEEQIIKTKIYIGHFISTYKTDNPKITIVLTTKIVLSVRNLDVIPPDSAWCYIRIEPTVFDVTADIAEELEHDYFSWRGSKKEYRVVH